MRPVITTGEGLVGEAGKRACVVLVLLKFVFSSTETPGDKCADCSVGISI